MTQETGRAHGRENEEKESALIDDHPHCQAAAAQIEQSIVGHVAHHEHDQHEQSNPRLQKQQHGDQRVKEG